ncbi:MAG: ChaN family lipoprotein, partial [Nitrospinota bacterium]
KELMEYLSRYPVVYFGETHDSVQDHDAQLAILEYFNKRYPGEVALGLEMFRRPAQAGLDSYIRGEMDEREFVKLFYKNWGGLYPYYREITDYARRNGIPLVALNASKELRKEIRQKGIDGLDAEMKNDLPEMNMDDPYHRALMKAHFGKHVKGPKQLETFYRMQVLWDETMAQSAADYLNSPAGGGKRLLIFAGDAHVRYGLGIPRRLFRRLPIPYAIVSAYTVEIAEEKKKNIMHIDVPAIPLLAGDFLWGVRYEGLEGETVRLGVTIGKVPGDKAEGKGVSVLGIVPGSSAEKAGILKGDLLVSMDGQELHEPLDLTYQVGLHKPGDSGNVELIRDGKRLSLEVTYYPPKSTPTH